MPPEFRGSHVSMETSRRRAGGHPEGIVHLDVAAREGHQHLGRPFINNYRLNNSN